ncbi:hypothetical protein NC652_003446 [Populus alba x Populus x berolinensis]|nr:hypothetical protein NC652_003446 [Populus alba x Populus x berolinensis]
MKNLPMQEAKSKMVACFGSLGFSSLLCFFSSFPLFTFCWQWEPLLGAAIG